MKIILAFALLAVPTMAEEWALVDSSGTVKTVIVADAAHIATRTDGTWVKTTTKVGNGWKRDSAELPFQPIKTLLPVDTKTVEWTKF